MNIFYLVLVSATILQIIVSVFKYYSGLLTKKDILFTITDVLLDLVLITLAVSVGF